jgi:hypothetical protein
MNTGDIIIICIGFALVGILFILICIKCYISFCKQQNKSNVKVEHFNDPININIDRIIENEELKMAEVV